MFCHRCGVRLADDALFCMKCGAKRPLVDGDDAPDEDEERNAATDSTPPVQDAKPMPRTMPDSDNRTLTLGRMTPAQLIALLKPLDDQFAQISALEHGIRSAYDAMNSNRSEYYAGVACFLISGFIGAMAMVYALVSEPWNHQAPVTALVTCLVALIPLLIGLNQIRVYRHNVDVVMPDLYPAIAADEQSIENIRKAMRPTLLLMPITCRNGEANAYILQMLLCGRADDFNTAVNLWEEYSHRRLMERFEQEKVDEARKQTTALAVSAVAQVSQAFEAKRQTRALQDLRDDLNNRR